LPEDVLRLICEELTIDEAAWLDRQPRGEASPPSYDRAPLARLCITCKRFMAVATPCLYRTIDLEVRRSFHSGGQEQLRSLLALQQRCFHDRSLPVRHLRCERVLAGELGGHWRTNRSIPWSVRSLVLTRGVLSPDHVDLLAGLPSLRHLDICGISIEHPRRKTYDRLTMPALRYLVLVQPVDCDLRLYMEAGQGILVQMAAPSLDTLVLLDRLDYAMLVPDIRRRAAEDMDWRTLPMLPETIRAALWGSLRCLCVLTNVPNQSIWRLLTAVEVRGALALPTRGSRNESQNSAAGQTLADLRFVLHLPDDDTSITQSFPDLGKLARLRALYLVLTLPSSGTDPHSVLVASFRPARFLSFLSQCFPVLDDLHLVVAVHKSGDGELPTFLCPRWNRHDLVRWPGASTYEWAAALVVFPKLRRFGWNADDRAGGTSTPVPSFAALAPAQIDRWVEWTSVYEDGREWERVVEDDGATVIRRRAGRGLAFIPRPSAYV
jgi:hypothetical protein